MLGFSGFKVQGLVCIYSSPGVLEVSHDLEECLIRLGVGGLEASFDRPDICERILGRVSSHLVRFFSAKKLPEGDPAARKVQRHYARCTPDALSCDAAAVAGAGAGAGSGAGAWAGARR